MYKSIGIFKYGPGMKAALMVDQSIADYYRSLIPKWIHTNPQKYPAHVSVVRKAIPPNMEFWDKYEGEQISFEYSNEIINDETYFWLDVKCKKLEEIRMELGLSAYPPWRNLYHITIANCKESPTEVVASYFKDAFN